MTLVVVGMVLALLAGILIGMLATHLTWRGAKWSLSHSRASMQDAARMHERASQLRLKAYEGERNAIGEGSEVARQLALLTIASEKLEKIVAHLFLQSQEPGRRMRGPQEATQRGEEILPFPPGTQRAKLPEQEPIQDGFEKDKEISRPGILKNRVEPARGEPS